MEKIPTNNLIDINKYASLNRDLILIYFNHGIDKRDTVFTERTKKFGSLARYFNDNFNSKNYIFVLKSVKTGKKIKYTSKINSLCPTSPEFEINVIMDDDEKLGEESKIKNQKIMDQIKNMNIGSINNNFNKETHKKTRLDVKSVVTKIYKAD